MSARSLSPARRKAVVVGDELGRAFADARDAFDLDPTTEKRDAMYACARLLLQVGERPVTYAKDAAGRLLPIVFAVVAALLFAACGGTVGAGVDASADVVAPLPDAGPDVIHVDAHEASAPDVVVQVEAGHDAAPDASPDVVVQVDAGDDAAPDAPILVGCPAVCEGGTKRVSCNCLSPDPCTCAALDGGT